MKIPSLNHKWLDSYALPGLALFLLIFIPLWPKIPLFSPIEQYIVRVRLEDILVAITGGLWVWQQWKERSALLSPISKGIGLYLGVGLASVVSALFIINTVPLEPIHLGKTILHYLRYTEYFLLFFIAYTSLVSKKHLKLFFAALALSVAMVAIYGFGQRYFYFPVYSTMNREFSKGVRLYLTRHARVQSTFAGHYDLGAYLVIALPLLLALSLSVRQPKPKIALHTAHWLGLWLLVVSASRTSFIAYILAATLVILLYALKQKSWMITLRFGFTRLAMMAAVVLITSAYFGQDVYERFLQVLQSYPELNEQYHQLNRARKQTLAALVGESSQFKIPELEAPANGISTDQAQQVILDSDTRPTPYRPADVYVDVPEEVIEATVSADGTVTEVVVVKERVYSPNALKYGLSIAIRLDTLWPQAIASFERNPLLGTGYATLNKTTVEEFTEIDGVDNNFLRTLGETGLLGFLAYYGTIILALGIATRSYLHSRDADQLQRALAVGYIAGTIGLLLNATFIDVFAASKVAFIFWLVTGVLASHSLDSQTSSVTVTSRKKRTNNSKRGYSKK